MNSNENNLGIVSWGPEEWCRLEQALCEDVLQASSDDAAWHLLVRQARRVLRKYSTSFFLVTRFLPYSKRNEVEVVYAAVRYPDEVVDTFPWNSAQKMAALNSWCEGYEKALSLEGIREALRHKVPCFLASFVQVVRKNKIPPEHYRAFMQAMKSDVDPHPFSDLDDLIKSYVYGSAVVVGYFLAYIYGPRSMEVFPQTLQAAYDLGIALQLTNFLRDVREDHRRGRLYIPMDLLRAQGIVRPDPTDETQRKGFAEAIRNMVDIAEDYYRRAEHNLTNFSQDSLPAIRACLKVYRQLNVQIGANAENFDRRESVPILAKFRLLPRSKYWRLPLAYLKV